LRQSELGTLVGICIFSLLKIDADSVGYALSSIPAKAPIERLGAGRPEEGEER
jgi:hypothetical protein